MVDRYPEVRQHLERVQATMEAFARSMAKEPPPQLKDKIMQEISTGETTRPPKRSWGWIWPWILAVLGWLTVLGLYLQTGRRNQEQKQLQEERDRLQSTQEEAIAQLELLADPGTRIVFLKALEEDTIDLRVIWNPREKMTLLALSQLPPPPAGKQYQFWTIVNGQAISAGLVKLEGSDIQSMDAVQQADQFAVSLEDEGGSAQPTKVVAIGQI